MWARGSRMTSLKKPTWESGHLNVSLLSHLSCCDSGDVKQMPDAKQWKNVYSIKTLNKNIFFQCLGILYTIFAHLDIDKAFVRDTRHFIVPFLRIYSNTLQAISIKMHLIRYEQQSLSAWKNKWNDNMQSLKLVYTHFFQISLSFTYLFVNIRCMEIVWHNCQQY